MTNDNFRKLLFACGKKSKFSLDEENTEVSLPAHGAAERRCRADGLYAARLFRVRGGVAPARIPPREGG
jgi:hypothetical protein